mgnify:FL=1
MASLTTNQQQLQTFAYAKLTFEHCENLLSEIHSYVKNEDWGKNLSILIDYLNFTCSNTFHLHNLKVPNPEGNGKSVDDSEHLIHFYESKNDIYVIIDSGLRANSIEPIYLCFKGDTISSLKLTSVVLHKDLDKKYPDEIDIIPLFAITYYLYGNDFHKVRLFRNWEWRKICFTKLNYDFFEKVVDNIYNQANQSLSKPVSQLHELELRKEKSDRVRN